MKRISLDGLWDFVVDLDPKYHGDKVIYPAHYYSAPGWSRRNWSRAPVPGVWNKYAERMDIFEGVGWFVREFDLTPSEAQGHVRLRFGAVNYYCTVYLNGERVWEHEGGYTEFTVDLTGRGKAGTNHLAVCVDNRASMMRFPAVLGYFNYGGIHRSVTLELADGAFLDDVVVEAEPTTDGGRLRVSGVVRGLGGPARIQLQCESYNTEAELSPNGGFCLDMAVPDARPWEPRSPFLYDMNLVLIENNNIRDEFTLQCGFRKIAVSDNRILLNGNPLWLKGVCYVFDSPSDGLCMKQDQIDEDIALLQGLGVNCVRCHYPMDRLFYDACDRAGIIVWIEPPIYCMHPADSATGTPFADPAWQALGKQMLREMIVSARNHPCVGIYGIGNECNTYNQESSSFFREMAASVRNLDQTRLVSYAALYGRVGDVSDVVDVLGINSYWGWYDKNVGGKGLQPEDDELIKRGGGMQEPIDLAPMRAMLDEVLSKKDIALLLTEFGADSAPGYFSNSRDLWSEDYHADLLREIFKLTEDYPLICGAFPFCFSDYRDPSKHVNDYWNEFNLKGLVTYTRRKKLAYDALSRIYGERSSAH